MMNMYWEPLDFELPAVAGPPLGRAVDTAPAVAGRHRRAGTEQPVDAATYHVSGAQHRGADFP